MGRVRASVYNSFNLRASQSRLDFKDIGPCFRRLGKQHRDDIRNLSVGLNMNYRNHQMGIDYLYGTYTRKLRLLGSRDRRVHISFDDAKQELAANGEELPGYWSARRIKQFITRMDMPTSDHLLAGAAEVFPPGVLLPGQKCSRNDQTMADFCRDIPKPLKTCNKEILTDDRLSSGVVIGLRLGSCTWRRFDIYISVKSHAKLICYEIDDANVDAWDDVSGHISGDFTIPRMLKRATPRTSRRAGYRDAHALVFYLYRLTWTGPLFRKETVGVFDGSRRCLFKKEFVLRGCAGYIQANAPAAPKNRQNTRRKGNITVLLPERIVGEFGGDFDMEWVELGNV